MTCLVLSSVWQRDWFSLWALPQTANPCRKTTSSSRDSSSLSLCPLHRVPYTCKRPGDIIMPRVDLLRAMAEGICVLASRGCERLCYGLGHLLGRDADDQLKDRAQQAVWVSSASTLSWALGKSFFICGIFSSPGLDELHKAPWIPDRRAGVRAPCDLSYSSQPSVLILCTDVVTWLLSCLETFVWMFWDFLSIVAPRHRVLYGFR